MTSLFKFAYALLAATLSLTPNLASALEARGHFTLTHDVLWGNVDIPRGEYAYSYDALNPPLMLTLQQVDGARKAYMLLVSATDTTPETDTDRLLIKSSPAARYVSAMQLSEIGIMLEFLPPTRAVIARNAIASSSGGR